MLNTVGHISLLWQRVLLVIGCGLLFFLWWSPVPLTEWDEARYCAAVREMTTSGNFVVPMYNHIERYQKPILYYWLQAPSVAIFGPSEWAARLPSGVLMLVLVLLIHQFLAVWLPTRARTHGDRVRARGAAFLAAAVLAVMPFTVVWARGATTDATTTFFTSLALLALLQADLTGRAPGVHHRHRRVRLWYCLAAAACGLAFMAKGPVGVAVPVLVWLVYHGLNRELPAEARRVPWLLAVPIFLLVALPWYAMIVSANGWGFIKRFFLTENLGRFAQAQEGHSVGHGLHPALARILGLLIYYPIAALLAFPASPFVVRELIAPFSGNDAARQDDLLPRIRRFAVVWVFTNIVLLSLASTQLPSYIHAIIGGVALLLAVHLYARIGGEAPAEGHRGARIAEAVLFIVLGLIFPAITLVAALMPSLANGLLGVYPQPQPLATILAVLAAVLAIAFVASTSAAYRRRDAEAPLGSPLALWPAMLALFLVTAVVVVQRGYGPTHDVGTYVAEQPEAYRVLVYRSKAAESLIYYMARDRAVEFYLLARERTEPDPLKRPESDGQRYTGFAPSWWPRDEEHTRAFWQTLDAVRATGEPALIVTDATGEARIRQVAPDAEAVYGAGNAVVLRVGPTPPTEPSVGEQ